MATATLTEVQARWHDVVEDPVLRDLPYKVETNHRGQLILSPHRNRHSIYQGLVEKLLNRYCPEGIVAPEFALATPEGVKVPDVVWMSPERLAEMDATGDPSTLAPEICVEVLCPGNTPDEIADKRALYRSIGAEEVWIVTDDGQIRFYRDAEINRSGLVPTCPERIQAKPE